MASAPSLPWKGLAVALLLLVLTLPSTESDGSTPKRFAAEVGEKKSVLGSRPPTCLNKCFRCWPCKATLVITPRRRARNFKTSEADDSDYYLLTWKCSCGNKLFHP